MGLDVVRVAAWTRYPWLVHGFSTRGGGVTAVFGGRSLNLGWTKEDAPQTVTENRRLLVEAVAGEGAWPLVTLSQVHGTEIRTVGINTDTMRNGAGRAAFEGDGLVTAAPGVLLGMQTADCVPVMLVDLELRVVAVLHAGWRGTSAGMAAVGVERMRAEFGSRVEDIVAAVGPSIGACCYTVGEEVRAAFFKRFSYAGELFLGDRLDLWEANRRQLVEAGVAAERVTVVRECTGCSLEKDGERRYFSHRVERGVAGRMMSVVGVRIPIEGRLNAPNHLCR